MMLPLLMMMSRRNGPVAVLAVLAAASPALAGGFVVVEGDRLRFDDLLRDGSTVIDSGGTFAADPVAAGGLDVVRRSGTLGGDAFVVDLYDVDTAPLLTGTLTPGAAGGDVLDTDRVGVETPAAQSGAIGAGSWGLDSGAGSTASPNGLLVDFVATPGGLGVGHFGVDLLDFEASAAFTAAQLRLYDNGLLVFSHTFSLPSAGNGAGHFLGVVAIPADGGTLFDQALVVVGDDGPGDGRFERWAADRFTFGTAVTNPEPGTWALFAAGLFALAVGRRRRRRPPLSAERAGPP